MFRISNYPFLVLLLPLIAFILCCTYAHWPMELNRSVDVPETENDTTKAFYLVVLNTPPQPAKNTYRYESTVLTGESVQPKARLFLRHDSTEAMPLRGDTLLVYTHWNKASGSGYVHRFNWQIIGHDSSPWWCSAYGWQQVLKQRYRTLGVADRELATICALTLGSRYDLNPLLKQQFSAAGAMHVLAVSGLHTGILMIMLMALITLFGLHKPLYEQRIRRVLLGAVVILALIAYAWLTGSTPSVVRSVVMCSMVLMAWMCNRESQMMNTLFASAFFILLFRPMDLYSVSFQLSYAAVFAIALFAPGWNRILPKNYFLGIVGMSIAAQIGTMPISLYYFGQISNYFLLTNCIVLPLAWGMMVLGLLTLTIGWFTPLGLLLAWLLNGLTWCMNETVGWIESLPHATTQVYLPLWGMWTFIGINLLLVIAWNKLTTPKLSWK